MDHLISNTLLNDLKKKLKHPFEFWVPKTVETSLQAKKRTPHTITLSPQILLYLIVSAPEIKC
ncbi:hypothetical protein BpHYR1_043133 [Brachionus plicatilis]|uniref:Uncharacterized protein n=1 Tax=Brachionus plicatilis TaxID=10195 RepID=A0A3M7Q0R0_BRAPC|nr:hypothetical protein BpHYR1_043133 [Brachionus plicatilis]